MADVNYGSLGPQGGYRATVSDTPGYGGGGMGGEDMSWLMEAARRRAVQQVAQGDLSVASQAAALRRANERPGPIASRSSAPVHPYVPERMPLRDMMQANSALRSGLAGGTDMAGAGISGNPNWSTMPMAASLTGNQMPQSGWDTWAKLASAGSAPSAQAVGTAGETQQQQDAMRFRAQYPWLFAGK
jgi:hypothetical protein